MQLTGYGVVSLLLVHRDLGEPGSSSQQLDLVTLAKLVLSKHLALFLSAPVNMVFKYTHTEGVPYIWERCRNV